MMCDVQDLKVPRKNLTQDFKNSMSFNLFSSLLSIHINEAPEYLQRECVDFSEYLSWRKNSLCWIFTTKMFCRKSIPAFTEVQISWSHYLAALIYASFPRWTFKVHDEIMDSCLESLLPIATSSTMTDIGSLVCEKQW